MRTVGVSVLSLTLTANEEVGSVVSRKLRRYIGAEQLSFRLLLQVPARILSVLGNYLCDSVRITFTSVVPKKLICAAAFVLFV